MHFNQATELATHRHERTLRVENMQIMQEKFIE